MVIVRASIGYLPWQANFLCHALQEGHTLGVVRVWLHCVNPDILPEEGGGGVLTIITHLV